MYILSIMGELIRSDTAEKLTFFKDFKPNPKIAITQKVLNIIYRILDFKNRPKYKYLHYISRSLDDVGINQK